MVFLTKNQIAVIDDGILLFSKNENIEKEDGNNDEPKEENNKEQK